MKSIQKSLSIVLNFHTNSKLKPKPTSGPSYRRQAVRPRPQTRQGIYYDGLYGVWTSLHRIPPMQTFLRWHSMPSSFVRNWIFTDFCYFSKFLPVLILASQHPYASCMYQYASCMYIRLLVFTFSQVNFSTCNIDIIHERYLRIKKNSWVAYAFSRIYMFASWFVARYGIWY